MLTLLQNKGTDMIARGKKKMCRVICQNSKYKPATRSQAQNNLLRRAVEEGLTRSQTNGNEERSNLAG